MSLSILAEFDLHATLFGMSVLEIVAAVLGLLNVWLTVKERVLCWPVGAAMVALYAFVFYKAQLYADMGLQVVYFVLQFYGWYQWLHGGAAGACLRVGRASKGTLVLLGGMGVAGSAGMGLALSTLTNASLPYLDSTATAFSLVAQWMLTRKHLENWLVWIAVDVLSIWIYWRKDLYPTAVLYSIFLALAILGFWQWNRSYQAQTPA